MTILDEYCPIGLKHNQLKTENLSYKPLYFSPGFKRLRTDSRYSGTMQQSFAYILVIIFQIELKVVNSSYFYPLFQNLNHLKLRSFHDVTLMSSIDFTIKDCVSSFIEVKSGG